MARAQVGDHAPEFELDGTDAKQAVLGTKRSTFVIDGAGVIRFRHDATLGLTYLPADDLRAAIAASQPSS